MKECAIPGPQSGFSLLEAMVSLALLALILLGGMGLLGQQPGAEARLAAHGEALLAMEGLLEAIRAGAEVPPPMRPVEGAFSAAGAEPAARDLVLWVEAEPVGAPQMGLLEVAVIARYRAGGRPFERRLESRVWRP